ncbi:MAG: hypothetical protein M9898_05130 [Chitinophagaceae bacterium]|nr:hypothetical protein [Chitinophagaceae bacterium]
MFRYILSIFILNYGTGHLLQINCLTSETDYPGKEFNLPGSMFPHFAALTNTTSE